jgi:hypothetical protein
MNSMKKIGVYILAGLAAPALLSGCFARENTQEISEEAELNGGALVRLIQQVGEVTITGSDENRIVMQATKKVKVWSPFAIADPASRFDDIDVSFSATADMAQIETDIRKFAWFAGLFTTANLSVEYNITVPRNTELDVECNVGAVTIEDVNGETAVTNNVGEVTLTDVTGVLEITNDVGDVAVEHSAFLKAAESMDIDVNVGDVGISLPEDSAFSVDANTSVGKIEEGGFGFAVTEDIPGARADETVGEGENPAPVAVTVDTGNIAFAQLSAAEEEFSDEEILSLLSDFWKGDDPIRARAIRIYPEPENEIVSYRLNTTTNQWDFFASGTFSLALKAAGTMLIEIESVYDDAAGEIVCTENCADSLDFSVSSDELEITGAGTEWFSEGVYLRSE